MKSLSSAFISHLSPADTDTSQVEEKMKKKKITGQKINTEAVMAPLITSNFKSA